MDYWYIIKGKYATLAQQVEHHHGKVGVVGSNPIGGLDSMGLWIICIIRGLFY